MLAKVLDYRRYFPILSFLFLYQTARGMSLPLLPQYYLSLGFSAIDIGLAFAAYSISFLIFEALWGFVFEKFGTKGSMPPLAIALTATAMLLFSRPSGLTEVIGFMVIFGIGLGGAGVFPRLVIAHLTPYSNRGRAYGILGFTYSIGATVGSLLGGVAGALFGISNGFILTAVVFAASLIPVLLGNLSEKRKPPLAAQEVTVAPDVPASPRRFNKQGVIILGMVGLIAAGGNAFFSLLFPNILLKEPRFVVTPIEISIVLALYNLSTGLMQPLVGSLGSRRPVSWITGCLFATGICYFFLITAQNLAEIEIVTIALGVVYSAITPLALSLLTTFVPKGYWGRIIGVYGAAEDVGLLVGTSLGGFVWGIWGAQYSFLMMGSIYGFVAAACFVGMRTGKLGQNSRSIDSIKD